MKNIGTDRGTKKGKQMHRLALCVLAFFTLCQSSRCNFFLQQLRNIRLICHTYLHNLCTFSFSIKWGLVWEVGKLCKKKNSMQYLTSGYRFWTKIQQNLTNNHCRKKEQNTFLWDLADISRTRQSCFLLPHRHPCIYCLFMTNEVTDARPTSVAKQ